MAGGGASLRRDPVSIGALVISFCPKFPMRTVDNQYHLQALRHLYVLAVEWRSLVTVEVSTKQSVASKVSLSRLNHGEETTELVTPCLLPELTSFDQILVDDPRYCLYKALKRERGSLKVSEARFLRDNSSVAMRNVIFVKKRSSCAGLGAFAGNPSSVIEKLRENIPEIRCFEAVRRSPVFAALLSNEDKRKMSTVQKGMYTESLNRAVFEYIINGSLPSDTATCMQLSSFLLRYSLLPFHRWQNVDQVALRSAFEISYGIDELGVRLAVMSMLYRTSRT